MTERARAWAEHLLKSFIKRCDCGNFHNWRLGSGVATCTNCGRQYDLRTGELIYAPKPFRSRRRP